MSYTAHVDTFARDNLPPRKDWPEMLFELPELKYPARMNCAVELLEGALARGWRDRVAIRAADGHCTYGQLLAQANRIARVLVEDMGLVPGNRVLLRGPNNPMMAACWFGVFKAGGIVVGTMPLLRAKELTEIIGKAQVTHALCDKRLEADLATALPGCPTLKHVKYWYDDDPGVARRAVRGQARDLRQCRHLGRGSRADRLHFRHDGHAERDGAFSSRRDRDVRLLSALVPETLEGGCFLRHAAARVHLRPGRPAVFSAAVRRVHRAARKTHAGRPARSDPEIQGHHLLHRADVLPADGPAREEPQHQEPQEMRLGRRSAAGRHPAAVQERHRHRDHRRHRRHRDDPHLHFAHAGKVRRGATGYAIPGYKATVLDPKGKPCAPGVVGRLAVKGPTGCRYLADERQKVYVQKGWNVTGDAYAMDKDGYFFYQARTDDMIVSAGYNIAGPEVEGALLAHEAVAECGVVGAADEERGQIVKAYVVLKPGYQRTEAVTKMLQDHVKNAIAPYKYPRAIEFIDALPRTETGKLQRFKLRTKP